MGELGELGFDRIQQRGAPVWKRALQGVNMVGGMREEEKGVGELGERCLNGVKKREHLRREGGSA